MMQIEQACTREEITILKVFSANGKERVKSVEKINRNLFKRILHAIKQLFKSGWQTQLKIIEKEHKPIIQTGSADIPTVLHIEISSEKINLLLQQRQICAADVHCLNTESKQCLQKLCLKTCLEKTIYSNPVY